MVTNAGWVLFLCLSVMARKHHGDCLDFQQVHRLNLHPRVRRTRFITRLGPSRSHQHGRDPKGYRMEWGSSDDEEEQGAADLVGIVSSVATARHCQFGDKAKDGARSNPNELS
jgi:hypothetical protein